MRFTLAKQIALLFTMLTAVVFSETGLVYQYQRKTEQFGLFAGLAGKDTFLSQRLELLLYEVLRGDSGQAEALEQMTKDFDDTLSLFEAGGVVLGQELHPVPESVARTVREHRTIWNELHPILTQIVAGSASEGESDEIAERARLLTHQLVDSSYRLDEEFENWRGDLRMTLRLTSVALSILAVLIVSAAIVLAWKQVMSPVRKIKTEILRVTGTGAQKLPQGDIKAVADMVSEVTADVDRLRVEREEAKEELRHIEEDYRVIFLNAVAGIVQISVDGRIRAANPALASMLGYDSILELMTSVEDAHRQLFVDPAHKAQIATLSGSGGGALQLETQVYRKDGSTMWVLESISVAGASSDSRYYYEGVLVDITARKEAEGSLRKLSGELLRSQEEERRRIGRELHDSTGQLLAALSMNLDRLSSAEDHLTSGEREALSGCAVLTEQCLREIRSVSHLLHPPLLEELGLVFTLRDYIDGFNKRSGIQVETELTDDIGRLSPDAEMALFRFVQEALTNIHRHANTSRAEIRLGLTSDDIRLEVQDHGRGLPPEVYDAGGRTFGRLGVGLSGMKERLNQLGGRLTIQTGDGGTLLRAELPVSRAREEEPVE